MEEILERIISGVSAHELVALVAIIYLWRRLTQLEDRHRERLEEIIDGYEREGDS